jgi:hypothetical protein
MAEQRHMGVLQMGACPPRASRHVRRGQKEGRDLTPSLGRSFLGEQGRAAGQGSEPHPQAIEDRASASS